MSTLRTRGRRVAARARNASIAARALRQRVRPSPPLRIDLALRLDADAVLVRGSFDPSRVAPDASPRASLGAGAVPASAFHRHASSVPGRLGFSAEFELSRPAALAPEARPLLTLEARAPDGSAVAARRRCAPFAGDALARVRALLALMPPAGRGRRAALDAGLGEAIARTWQARPGPRAADAELVHHNRAFAPAAPRASLVIPIYGRHDFIAHQLAHFARDPSLRDCELIWVIDDPRLDEAVRRSCAALARLHDVAFSVLHLGCNLGYAGANNAAAAVARGDALLLLNSDVMPVVPGWLDEMLAVAEAAGRPAVVGARLLYEDGGVQHDGMRPVRAESHEGLWLNLHPGKGLPADLFDDAAAAAPREAVTGACLLLPRASYERLGGLDERYVLGDFEDSDLCMKAHADGHEVLIATRARLYHLERQSQSLVTRDDWKADLTWFNCWQHARRWSSSLEAQASGAATVPAAPADLPRAA